MHIVLYILDALRADHLGCYGYERETSPNIDALCTDGVMFENCFTSSTWTRPVAASILTGTYPGVHRTRSRHDAFSTDLPRLPQVLQANGFKTAAFSTMGNIASEIGFDRGFDSYFDLFLNPDVLSKRRKMDPTEEGLLHIFDQEIALPRAEDINDYLFPWIKERRDNDTFCFIWSIETHVPYTAPREYVRFSGDSYLRPNEGEREDVRNAGAADRQRLVNLYDDEIYYNDHCIGQIIDYYKTQGIFDSTIFIILGDHGDAFYEHGVYAHGHTPYDELIHVPMIIKLQNNQYAGQRHGALIELIDIFPTIIGETGIHSEAVEHSFLQGKDVTTLLNGTDKDWRDYVFSDTQMMDVQNHYMSVRGYKWKYIQIQQPERSRKTVLDTLRYVIERHRIFNILRSPRHFIRNYFVKSNEYLFDLENDPGEQNNIANDHPEKIAHFKQVIENWQQENDELSERFRMVSHNFDESEILRQHLEKLGYL